MIPEIWSSTDRIFSHFGPFFAFLLPSPYPKNSENQNFEKMEKTPGDIIILSVPEMTIIQYMVTEIGTETDRMIFVILDNFLPFYPTNPKNRNLKKNWRYHHFTKVEPKIMIMYYTVPEWHVMDIILFFILGYFLPFYLLTAPKMKISKK